MAYPPDWTVDESYLPDPVIFFIGPSGNTDEESVTIVWGARESDANIDVLRDDFFYQRSEFCVERGIEFTDYRQLSNITFAILGAACDQGGALFFLQSGTGLNGGDEWDIFMRTDYERKEQMLRTIFDPMLASLNIYALLP